MCPKFSVGDELIYIGYEGRPAHVPVLVTAIEDSDYGPKYECIELSDPLQRLSHAYEHNLIGQNENGGYG